MNKKIINLNKHEDFIGLENVKDLYSILDYKPVLITAGFNNNYLEYGSDGNNSLSFMEYLNLIKPYLEDLINEKNNKDEWKLQLTAKISFVSLKPDSDETRLMHTRSNAAEFRVEVKQRKSLRHSIDPYCKIIMIIFKKK